MAEENDTDIASDEDTPDSQPDENSLDSGEDANASSDEAETSEIEDEAATDESVGPSPEAALEEVREQLADAEDRALRAVAEA
ncbi:MAG: hypothetical protein VYC07_04470, partial [Pseudomonadota bacterium]|nr:hypothetical protein [Pseudomonadota bacterium]